MGHFPRHVGIIMDGNGRWAKQRGLARSKGHQQGVKTFEAIVRHAAKVGVEVLTVYAFSTENWARPKEEVDGLMSLIRRYLQDVDKYRKDNMRLRILGDKSGLPEDIAQQAKNAEKESAQNTGMQLCIAINYGGRDEIVRAARKVVQAHASGQLALDQLTADRFEDFLDTAALPEVDLIIRTGGEKRISNFLLWQGAYAEYIFLDTLFPDLSPALFDEAIQEFASRDRRRGRSESE
jgi:undecaprenyl diphosphate synthase